MTSPFDPPEHEPTSVAASMPAVAIGASALAFLMTLCGGLLAAMVAWMLPAGVLVWSLVVYTQAEPDSPDRPLVVRAALISIAGLFGIPLAFVLVVCLGIVVGMASVLAPAMFDTIMSA